MKNFGRTPFFVLQKILWANVCAWILSLGRAGADVRALFYFCGAEDVNCRGRAAEARGRPRAFSARVAARRKPKPLTARRCGLARHSERSRSPPPLSAPRPIGQGSRTVSNVAMNRRPQGRFRPLDTAGCGSLDLVDTFGFRPTRVAQWHGSRACERCQCSAPGAALTVSLSAPLCARIGRCARIWTRRVDWRLRRGFRLVSRLGIPWRGAVMRHERRLIRVDSRVPRR